MARNTTLLMPPPIEPSKSIIENLLELTDLSTIEPVSTLMSKSGRHE